MKVRKRLWLSFADTYVRSVISSISRPISWNMEHDTANVDANSIGRGEDETSKFLKRTFAKNSHPNAKKPDVVVATRKKSLTSCSSHMVTEDEQNKSN